MTSDVSRLLTLKQSLLELDGKQPFKFEVQNSILALASIATVVFSWGGVGDSDALGIAKTVISVTEGCAFLPSSNMVWWRHVNDPGPGETVLIVFVRRQERG